MKIIQFQFTSDREIVLLDNGEMWGRYKYMYTHEWTSWSKIEFPFLTGKEE